MRKVILVNGLKRSGNHAVINWLRAHGSFTFFNNVIPVRPILNGQPLPPPFETLDAFLKSRVPDKSGRTLFSSGRRILISLEDMELDVPLIENLDDVKLYSLLILRDPRNLFASRIRKGGRVDNPAYSTDEESMRRVVALWKSHAREYLELTHRLRGQVVPVYYNAWFSSRDCRRQLSRQLGLRFTDKGLKKVSDWGGRKFL